MANDFEIKVNRQKDRLSTGDFLQIQQEVAQKRLAWCAQNQSILACRQPATPRAAFELLFLDYMGLSAHELPILSENENEIVWQSRNPCPTLSACLQLELDTRQICRAVYEKSTQAFISQLDPQLRFLRSYEIIRPIAGFCKEMIIKVDFKTLMRSAIADAATARSAGMQEPGVVIAFGNRIIGKAHDPSQTPRNQEWSAEMNAINQAVRTHKDPNLSGAILFSTHAPGPNGIALAEKANLSALVYGLSNPIRTFPTQGLSSQSTAGYEKKPPTLLEVIGGVLTEECRALWV